MATLATTPISATVAAILSPLYPKVPLPATVTMVPAAWPKAMSAPQKNGVIKDAESLVRNVSSEKEPKVELYQMVVRISDGRDIYAAVRWGGGRAFVFSI